MPLVKIEPRGKRPRHSKFFWVYRMKHGKFYKVSEDRNFKTHSLLLCAHEFHTLTGLRLKSGQWVKMHLVRY